MGLKYKIVTSSDYYVYDEERQIWRNRSDDEAYVEQLVENSPDLTIVGVVQPRADASSTILPIGVAIPMHSPTTPSTMQPKVKW